MNTLQHALKEWAVICRALSVGKQVLLLRKGGIAEASGQFQVEHRHFWLFPTYVHQQKDGILPEAVPLLEQAEGQRPPQGVVWLTHFAEVAESFFIHDLAVVEKLADLHIWSPQTVRARFEYRRPGLHGVLVRVYQSSRTFALRDAPEYAGCRSWVELDHELPMDGATPVLTEEAFEKARRNVNV
jgi:hypothetical protein